MSKLKQAIIEVDESLNNLKSAIIEKDTLSMTENEVLLYEMMNEKYSDIISILNYIGKCQNELSKKTRKNTL